LLKLYKTEVLQIETSDNEREQDNSVENNQSAGRIISNVSRGHSDSVRDRTVSQTSEHISSDLIQQS
jgi:hypothetical protein